MHLSRIDIIATSDGSGEHYDTVAIDGVVYRRNPNCIYALYLKTKSGAWCVSAVIKNEDLDRCDRLNQRKK